MEETGSGGGNDGGGGNGTQWRWWFLASVTQFGWGVLLWRRGYNGRPFLLPLKAAFVGSLFPGSFLTASVGALQASGINKVDDLIEAGANLRKRLGIRPVSGEK